MDARLMNLAGERISTVNAARIADYGLSESFEKYLLADLDRLLEIDEWDPEFSAKQQLVVEYLSCGINPDAASKYLLEFSGRQSGFGPEVCEDTELIDEIAHLLYADSREVFRDFEYWSIAEFLNKCLFYSNLKVVRKYKNNQSDIAKLFGTLVNGSWTDVMYAVRLYLYEQADDVPWSKSDIENLKIKMEEWKNKFLHFFDECARNVPRVYEWYSPNARAVLERCWSSIFDNQMRFSIISTSMSYAMSPTLSDALIAYIKSTPMLYEVNYNFTAVYEACYPHVYAEQPVIPRKLVQFYCIPNSSLRTFSDNCIWFLDLNLNGQLVPLMKQMKIQELKSNKEGNFNNSQSVAENYLNDLYIRGFPDEKISSEDCQKYILSLVEDTESCSE